MEIVAGDVCQVLTERFSDLRSVHLHYIVHMLCEHLHSHYQHGFVREIGCEIRERIFSALLTLVCNPPSEEMGIILYHLLIKNTLQKLLSFFECRLLFLVFSHGF